MYLILGDIFLTIFQKRRWAKCDEARFEVDKGSNPFQPVSFRDDIIYFSDTSIHLGEYIFILGYEYVWLLLLSSSKEGGITTGYLEH